MRLRRSGPILIALALAAASCSILQTSSSTAPERTPAQLAAALRLSRQEGGCAGHPARQPAPASAFVARDGSHLVLGGSRYRFGGANIYWLGLDENVGGIAYPTDFRIRDALRTAADMGATVVRSHTLGISVGNPLSLEPSLGQFNPQAFATIDYSIYEACRLGIRLIIPLTDNWHYYEGSYHNFTQWLGLPSADFYSSPLAINAFEQYIKVLLTHRNPLTGLELGDDPTIMSWELGNELNGMTPSWIHTIASYLHTLAPDQLVAAGQQYGINPATLTDPLVDIVDCHYYPPTIAGVEVAATEATLAGKVFIAGEYGSIYANAALFRAMESDTHVSGAAFWSLFAHLDTYGYEQHNDGETLHFPGISPVMRTRDHLIRAFDYAMEDVAEPPEPAPGTPLITVLVRTSATTTSGAGLKVAWRGTTDAATYSVEQSTTGPGGPWEVVCNRCATDDSTPWLESRVPAGSAWYRVAGFNEQGVSGPWSPVDELPASGAAPDPPAGT